MIELNNNINRDLLHDVHYLQINYEELVYDKDLCEEAQRKSILRTLESHLQNNMEYRKYFEQFPEVNNDSRSNIRISDIPLIPSSLFKDKKVSLSSVPENEITKYCTSSGTLGNISLVPRDNMTLINIFTSIYLDLAYYYGLEDFNNYNALILGPSPDEAKDLWFAYAISSFAIQWNTKYLQNGVDYNIEEVVKNLEELSSKNKKVLLVGPPPRIIDLCNYIRVNGKKIKLHEESTVISAGGWKRRGNESISREVYNQVLSDTFQLSPSRIKDCYNMVELNTVFSECDCQQKHIPPWTDVYARNARTNEVLPDGELGILSFYDASAISYPAFVLSEDFGRVYSDRCQCGRISKRVEIVRRLDKVETRGCALKMDTSLNAQRKVSNRYFQSYYRSPQLYEE